MPLIELAVAAAIAAAPPKVPRDTDPWWAPNGQTIAFEREAPGLDGAEVFFTPVTKGRETDIIGPGRPRGFRPVSGELLVEQDASTDIRNGSKISSRANTSSGFPLTTSTSFPSVSNPTCEYAKCVPAGQVNFSAYSCFHASAGPFA